MKKENTEGWFVLPKLRWTKILLKLVHGTRQINPWNRIKSPETSLNTIYETFACYKSSI
jgi:hypothetical protein